MKVIPYTSSDVTPLLDFMVLYESQCVSLISKVKEGAVPVFVLTDDSGGKICGVFSYSHGGTINHCIPLKDGIFNAATVNAVALFLKQCGVHNLFSVIGESHGTELFQTIIQNCFMFTPPYCIKYRLMEYHPAIPVNYISSTEHMKCVKCNEAMIEELFPMQMDYEKVEVIYNSAPVNPSLCRHTLESAVRERRVYACVVDGRIVAKANVSCRGIRSAYIGGVYTLPEERSKGYAEFLMQHIACDLTQNRLSPTLFVKENNIPAIKAYSNCGFADTGSYKICYYK